MFLFQLFYLALIFYYGERLIGNLFIVYYYVSKVIVSAVNSRCPGAKLSRGRHIVDRLIVILGNDPVAMTLLARVYWRCSNLQRLLFAKSPSFPRFVNPVSRSFNFECVLIIDQLFKLVANVIYSYRNG